MISADGRELPEVVAEEKCRHIVVPMTRKITPIQDLKCLWQLVKIFREERPDIVHSHTPKAGLLGMLAAKIAGVNTRIHTVAGLPLMVEKGLKFQILKTVEKITYAAANHVWPNSQSLMDFIKKKKLTSARKLHLIGNGSTNGINVGRFSPESLDPSIMQQVKDQISYDSNKTYLLSIGRLVKDKGIVEVVESFANLHAQNDTLRLILVGDFEQELDPLPESTLYQIKQNDAIIHIPWSNHVQYFMHLANNFIFASHREGFPNVLLQAGAMNLPVICSRISGNVDIVSQNETGLLFAPGNLKQMQNLIQYAITHTQVVQSMAVKLRDKIQREFQRDEIWAKIHSQYSLITAATPVRISLVQQLTDVASSLWQQPAIAVRYFFLSLQMRRATRRASSPAM